MDGYIEKGRIIMSMYLVQSKLGVTAGREKGRPHCLGIMGMRLGTYLPTSGSAFLMQLHASILSCLFGDLSFMSLAPSQHAWGGFDSELIKNPLQGRKAEITALHGTPSGPFAGKWWLVAWEVVEIMSNAATTMAAIRPNMEEKEAPAISFFTRVYLEREWD